MASSDVKLRRSQLRDHVKRLIVGATYTARGHFAESARLATWDSRLGLPATVASAVLSAGAGIAALLKSQPWVTFGLAMLATVLSAARTFLNLGDQADAHGAKANQYLTLVNDARFLFEVDLRNPDVSDAELAEQLRELWKRYNALNEAPPHRVSSQAYKDAKRGIEAGETTFENDPLWTELGD